MKPPFILRSAIAVPCAAFLSFRPSAAPAASIVWGPAQTIGSDSDVFQGRVVTDAYILGSAGLTGTTVNGTTFNPIVSNGTGSITVDNVTFSSSTAITGATFPGVPVPPFSNLSANYQKLTSTILANLTNVPLNLTIRGLTAGRIYTFQWWSSFPANATQFLTTATAGNSVTLNDNTTAAIGGVGQFSKGIFIADSTTESIDFTGGAPLLDAFQLVEGGHVQYNAPLSLAKHSTLSLGIASRSSYDSLTVTGTAHVGGTLNLFTSNGYLPSQGTKFTIIDAGRVKGQFSTVNAPIYDWLTLRPFYTKDTVYVEAVVNSFGVLPGLNPNEQAVGRNIDTMIYDQRAAKLMGYLYERSLNDLPGDLAKISPDSLTSIFTMGVALEQVQSLNLQRRTDDIRSGSSGFSAANLAINGENPFYSGGFGITTGVAGPNGNDGKEVKETREVAPAENRWGAFLSGTGEWVTVNSTNDAKGYDLASGGFTLGVDYKVCPNFAIGLAAGYTGTTADLADHGRVWMNGGRLGVYATTFAGGWYADVAAFGGYNSYDTRRDGLQGEARGDTDGGEVDGLFGTGYDFKVGGLTFGPTATFNYTYIGLNGFTEDGSLAPLNIHGGDVNSYRSAFGLRASYDWKCGGILVKPELRAAWQHEYGSTAYGLDSNFADGAGGDFTVNGPKLGRDSCLLGAGVAVQLNERTSVYGYYDGELGRTNYRSSAVTAGFRVSF